MADDTEIGGVIMPSASSAQPPIIAGMTSHLALRLIRENREKIPPSPLLSAFNVISTYFTVVCRVRVQKTQDNPPSTNCSDMGFSPIMAFMTYKGEVPMSP